VKQTEKKGNTNYNNNCPAAAHLAADRLVAIPTVTVFGTETTWPIFH